MRRGPELEQTHRGAAGVPADRYGNMTVDPTKNVLDLVEAAVRRQDDLRTADRELALSHIESQSAIQRIQSEHTRELARLRTDNEQQLRIKEAERLDAIRAVDVQAGQRASEVAAVQATTLAAQVATSAETLRNQVVSAASAQSIALAAALEPIQKDIQELRRTQYEAAGRSAVADPQISELKELVKSLATTRDTGTGKAVANTSLIAWVLGSAGFFGIGVSVVIAIITHK